MNAKCPNTGRRSEVRGQGAQLQIANCGQSTVGSGRWVVDRSQGSGVRGQGSALSTYHLPPTTYHLPFSPSPFRLQPTAYSLQIRRAFTLVELLVTIAIIGILAGLSLGAIRYARTAAAESQTKATIAKLNDIVMKQYESYMTRRVPIVFPPSTSPKDASKLRYLALLDLMRMEMPERGLDILCRPIGGWTQRPALNQMYLNRLNTSAYYDHYPNAKLLYMWISMSHPEAMENFSQNEIADLDHDGWPVFVDGWGMPIMFLRWAPGFSSGIGLNPNPFNPSNPTQPLDTSNIQTGDPVNDHDPFDTQRIFATTNYRLIPLIYSAGPDKKSGITVGVDYFYGVSAMPSDSLDQLDPYATSGGILVGAPDTTRDNLDNIHNHRIEQQ